MIKKHVVVPMKYMKKIKTIFIIITFLLLSFEYTYSSSIIEKIKNIYDWQVYFSPEDNCEDKIINELNKAKESIDIALYYLTSNNLVENLIDLRKNKVYIRIYLDESQKNLEYSKVKKIIRNNIDVKFESGSGLMHNKFCIIDNKIVITGSYNWTTRANKLNDENIIIIENKDIAKIYTDKFNKFWYNK